METLSQCPESKLGFTIWLKLCSLESILFQAYIFPDWTIIDLVYGVIILEQVVFKHFLQTNNTSYHNLETL